MHASPGWRRAGCGYAGREHDACGAVVGAGHLLPGRPCALLAVERKVPLFLDRLDIPEDYKLNYIIAIGYPAEQPEAKPRDESKVKYIKP